MLCGSGRGQGWVRWGRPLLSLGRPPLGPSPRISTGSCVTCSSPCVCGSNRLMSELVCLCGSVLSWDSRSVTVCSSRVRLCARPECVCVSRLAPVYLNRNTGKGEQKAIVEQTEGEQSRGAREGVG